MPRLRPENELTDAEKETMSVVARRLHDRCRTLRVAQYELTAQAKASNGAIRDLEKGTLKSRSKAEGILNALSKFAGQEWRPMVTDLTKQQQQPTLFSEVDEEWATFSRSLSEYRKRQIMDLVARS